SEAKPAEAAATAAAVERVKRQLSRPFFCSERLHCLTQPHATSQLKEQYPTLRYIRTSAKCNSNVHEAFIELTNDMIQHEAKMERLSADKDTLSLHGRSVGGEASTRSKCCF